MRRLIPWIGPAAALLARVPIGEGPKAIAALVAVFLGVPLAAWPLLAATTVARGGPIAVGGLAIGLPLLVLTALGLAGVPLDVLLAGLVALQFALAIAAMRTAPPAVRETTARDGSASRATGRAALIIACLAAALLAARAGTPLGPYDDALDHVATIRHVAATNRVDVPGAFYGRDQPDGQDIRKGSVHTGLAMAVRLADIDAALLWRWAAAVLAPLALAAFTALAATLAPGRALVAWLALPAWLIAASDPAWLLKSAYGGHAGLALAWAVIAGVLAGWGSLTAFLAGAALAGVHAYAPAQALVPLVGFALVAPRTDAMPAPPAWRRIGALLVGASIVEAGRLLVAAPSINPLSDQSMPWLMTGVGPIASPLQLLDWYGLAGVAAAVGVFGLAAADRRPSSRYLLVTLVAPLLLLLNPLLFGPVAKAFGSVANKIALVWSPPLAAILLAAAATRPDAHRATRVGAGVGLALVLLAAWPTLRPNLERLAVPAETAPRSLPRAAIDLIERHTPPEAVIAADPITSYAIPAMTGRRTIVTLHQHAPPGDGRALERIGVAAALGATCLPLAEAVERCRVEGANWVVVDANRTPRIDEYGAHRDPRNEVLERFGAARFGHLDLEGGGFRLFATHRNPPSASEAPRVPRGQPPDETLRVRSGDVELAVGRLSGEKSIARGATLEFPAWWRRTGPTRVPYMEVQAHLRLEHESVGEDGGPFSKLRRRLVTEPRLGGSLRARGVELPFRGLCPVAEWPTGEWLGDSLQIIVPQYIVPGRYRVELALEAVTLYPVLTPADLFSDADRYEGPELGWVTVE
jgi:hypothetical protein